MHEITLEKLNQIVGGKLRLATLPARHESLSLVGRVVTDSRQVQPGDVFWGMPGTRFDGSGFATDAFARGAVGVVVGQRYVQPWPKCWSLEVPDALQALQQLAAWNRDRFEGRVVAVTGSVGKTTTRQMIHSVLGSRWTGTSSPKNYNNHVGVPLSMLAMEPTDDFSVLELAASAPGEIASLTKLSRPQIGVITRIGAAHLDGFGSLDGIAASKCELIAGLPHDGWAILAGDDLRLRKLAAGWQTKTVWCGRSLENDLVATHVESHDGELSFQVDGQRMATAVWGRHYLPNVLAAVAVGRICGLSDREIARGLADFQPVPRRCQITKIGGATIIDDTYNASPLAMEAALELLRDFDAPGRRLVVCGDMRELGEASEQLHRNLGDQVVTLCGADMLVACGEHADEVVAGAQAAGMPKSRTTAVRKTEDLFSLCQQALQPGDVMLVKGSRALAMERLVQALQLHEPIPCESSLASAS